MGIVYQDTVYSFDSGHDCVCNSFQLEYGVYTQISCQSV